MRGARASAGGDRDENWRAEADSNSEDEDGDGKRSAITLSSLPRGYWATLFNLEVVKARNRPIEPPKKPESAPFFLATVHREGEAEPSFPDAGSAAAAAALVGSAAAAAEKGKPRVFPASSESADFGDAEDVPDFPAGGDDAWSDDDADADGGNGGSEKDEVPGGVKRKLGEEEEQAALPPVPRRSRILKQMKTATRAGATGPSRCKLADLLIECDEARVKGRIDKMDEGGDKEEGGANRKRRFEAVMTYLKKLPPPMVDVDMSLLCQGEWDEEGVQLVKLTMEFLLEEIRWVGRLVFFVFVSRLA